MTALENSWKGNSSDDTAGAPHAVSHCIKEPQFQKRVETCPCGSYLFEFPNGYGRLPAEIKFPIVYHLWYN